MFGVFRKSKIIDLTIFNLWMINSAGQNWFQSFPRVAGALHAGSGAGGGILSIRVPGINYLANGSWGHSPSRLPRAGGAAYE